MRNVFVIGPDPFNFEKLRRSAPDDVRLHELFTFEQVAGGGRYPLATLLNSAEELLRGFNGSLDGIMGFWDFPTSSLVPMLCERFGLATSPVETVAKCEHKFWCRVEQQQSVPGHIPAFTKVDPYDDRALERIRDAGIEFPFWVKPVQSFQSYLAFKIDDAEEFHAAMARVREEILILAASFNQLLLHLDTPADVGDLGGRFCVVEQSLSGEMFTVEGYTYKGEPRVHGIIDSVRLPGMSSFAAYTYPSQQPEEVQQEAVEVSAEMVRQLGFDTSTFNIEFFYDADAGRLSVLEVNPRISQSHSDLFEKVDGETNLRIMLDLALGQEPDFPHREGEFGVAGKFFVRSLDDGVVTRTPSRREIDRLTERFPGTSIHVNVAEGTRLSELPHQDSYSFDLANVFLGADDHRQLWEHYDKVAGALKFRFAEGRAEVA